MAPQPVILCGKSEHIGGGVVENLKPEYETIHFILTREAGEHEIPLILGGKGGEAPSVSTLGTRNYSQLPVAVITGAGYDEDDVAAMMKATQNAGGKQVPWLRPDTSKPTPPPGPEYGKALVARIKETIPILMQKGETDKAQVVFY